ncbi:MULTISPECIES: adenylate/guanylate cyclase domain-containing protein [unclassified Sinorhizobium]|uniref:adenylate/guanylate cyclase domain-containing protein n=1 Tax=unclassified Sinorhizobium TaxID=2613772 RepID=UPI0024C32486|nr:MULTISPECIES: adenylate/guanylate cyclase domain-containing protein [unclassified Sinorhizobium]MDK1373477.1 adenylate/guanylate cyclase domain-containing protein [Sinorhizobium sp. 6-70]MDK1479712.1 adenylate/guanylate cyclase domain-containing protein [Sinorhizobium sp. 6-117]
MERRLAAILAADVVGFSRLMEADEPGTLTSLMTHQGELLNPKIAEHSGRVVKLIGDGILAEFQSVLDAVACAVDIQRAMIVRNDPIPPDRRIEFRIGINLGDVILENGDIFGDGVNVASRLEGIARPGGIAVSAAVRDLVRERLDIAFEDTGDQHLKNITRPIRVYQLHLETQMPNAANLIDTPFALPKRPSIAVLPFENMSGDPRQDYFADGLVDDLITELAKIHSLFVIARNSSFSYKGRSVDVKQVARDLGVRYVLEGSVRQSANRIRITGQLVEGTGATHVWADRLEGFAEDLFDLQDHFVTSIVGALEPSMRRAEIERALRKRPDALDAYDLYLKALPHTHANSPAETQKALQLLEEALKRDPNYALAHAYAAWCREQSYFRGGLDERDKSLALEHCNAAFNFGVDDPQVLSIAAFVQANLTHDYDAAIIVLDRSLELNHNSALAYGFSALVNAHSQRNERAIEHALLALRLSPFDPLNYHPYCALTLAYWFSGRFEEAATYAALAAGANPNFSVAYAYLAAAYVELSNFDAARAAAKRLIELAPSFTINAFTRMGPFRPASMQSLANALKKIPLPL